MKNITTTLTTKAIFSDDCLERYSLSKCWDTTKPTLAIIMLSPSSASGISLDSTTMLVLNNASRLGYGTVTIVNLFSRVDDFALAHAEDEDPENMNAILSAAKESDAVVYAAGVGKAQNKAFLLRQTEVMKTLKPYEEKLYCLTNADGVARLQHPLSPAVRTWHLSPLKVEELLPKESKSKKPRTDGKFPRKTMK